jgi:anti-sigma-K factor RskA
MSGADRSHEQVRDDLAAYALGALPEPEAATLEQHLAECDSCRAQLRWLEPALDLLPASVEQHRPPGALRDRLMETVRAEAGREAPSDAVAKRRRFGLRLPALRPAIAFAAVAVLAVGIGVGYGLSDGGSNEATSGSASTEVVPLGPTSVGGTLERQGGLATLRLERMPKLRRDQVYEVWIERGDQLEASTLFVLDSEREATAAVQGELTGADRVLVTAEPRGGSEHPTGAPLLEARL